MTPLRKRMVEEMELRNFAPNTIQGYVSNVAKFVINHGKNLLRRGLLDQSVENYDFPCRSKPRHEGIRVA